VVIGALAVAAIALGVAMVALYVAQGDTAISPQEPPAPEPVPFLKAQTRKKVVVTLKSGTAFRGVLYSADPAVLVLRNAEAISPDGNAVIVDGEVVLLAGEIDFLQRP
jgi:small nuclear ribonucleoprotein (snRNP)-like protein